MTANFEEIKKFTSLAESWWDENGSFKTLHDINRVRLGYIIDQIEENFFDITSKNITTNKLENIKILDIGCGGGLVSIPLAKLGAKVTSIDPGYENIEIAKMKSKEKNLDIDFHNCDSTIFIQNLIKNENLLDNDKFDVVICLEVIEHVDDPEFLISDISKLMKSETKSISILSTINRNIKSKILSIYLAEYLLKMLPIGTHDYEKFIKPSEMRRVSGKMGMKFSNMSGISYNLFSRQWELSDDIDVNYIATLAKL